MSHRQILPPPSTVEDAMDCVALTAHNRSECAFNLEGWQEASQCRLRSLLPRSPHQLRLLYLLRVVLRQLSTAYHYNVNHNTAKAKPLCELRVPTPATQNSKVCEHNYNNCSKKKKWLSHRSRNSKTSRQSTQACTCICLPMCKRMPTPQLHNRHNYLAVLAGNWITSQISSAPTSVTLMRSLKNLSRMRM